MFPDYFFHVGDLTDGERNSTRKRPCGLAVSPLYMRVSCISNVYSGTEELKIVSQAVFYHSLAGPNSSEKSLKADCVWFLHETFAPLLTYSPS